jgi:hypothetical protein
MALMCWFVSILRASWRTLRTADLSPFLPRLRTLSKVGQSGEWRVVLHGQGSAFAGRLCAVRKSDSAIQQAHRRTAITLDKTTDDLHSCYLCHPG